MTLLEAIQARHSVRKYKDEPIHEDVLTTLQDRIREINQELGLHIQLVTGEPKAFSGPMAYGSFSGVKNYLVMAGKKGEDLDEKIGYWGEQLVLLAQTLGLNTCWAWLSYRKVAGTYELEGETYSEDADVFRDVVITRANDVPATPAAPQILNFSLNGSYGYLLELNIPLEDVDGNPIFASQLSYEIYKKVGGVESPVTLEAQYYEYATEDMTIIPYLYTDYWEVMQGGESVYVHAPGIEDWDAIGVKSIYTGGGETHESPITWYDLTTGINTITASDEQPTEYYDLMGRRVDASKLTRGIYITNTGRKVMVK